MARHKRHQASLPVKMNEAPKGSTDIQKYDIAGFRPTTKSILGKHYNDMQVLPYTPDALRIIRDPLLARQGLLIYQEVGRDDMVDLGKSLLVSSLVPEVRVVPGHDTATSRLIADKIAAQFSSMQGGILQKFHKCFEAFLFGFSVSEMQFGILTEGENAGDVALKDIKYRQPYFFDFVANKHTGELECVYQVDVLGKRTGEEVNIQKCIYFVVNDHIDPFRGQSIYRSVYWAWWQKQAFVKLRGIQAERRAGKLMMKHTDPTFLDPTSFKTLAETILENYQKSDGFVIPPGVDASVLQGEASPDDFTRLITECDRILLRPTKIPWLMVQEGIQSGSYSLAEVQERVMVSGHKAHKQLFQDKLSEMYGPVWWLCKLNDWDLCDAPSVVLEPAVDANRRASIELYNTCVTAGTLTPQPQDQNWIRAGVGLEEVDEVEVEELEYEEEPIQQQPAQFAESRYASIDFTPPKGVVEAAARGLELRREFGRGGTSIGLARARDLSNGKRISPDTVRRMVSFFARHESNKREGWSNPEDPSNGYIAWLLWGGEPGRTWAEKVRDQMENADGADSMQQARHYQEQRAFVLEFTDQAEKLKSELARALAVEDQADEA